MTYPRCDAPKDVLVKNLTAKFKEKGIEKMVVGQERHKDGGLHLHAVVILGKKTNIKDPRALDIVFDGKRYHGNY